MTRAEFRARLRGRRCYIGLDLSSTKDLTAAVAVFPDDTGPGFDVLAQFFVPQDSIRDRAARDRVPYDQWAREGHLVAIPGRVVDYEVVRTHLQAWALEFDVREIAFDPWNALDLVTRLGQQDGFVCIAIRQGMLSLSAPTKALETAVLSRTLRHDGHPVLRWNLSNVSVEADSNGNIRPSKSVSTERIDGVVALVMAIDRMSRNNSEKAPEYQMLILGSR
jgi:phage terminase large subunit-like protein